MNMKKIHNAIVKGCLIAGMAVLAVSSARAQYAQGDAVVAFTTGTGNDLIYDLGPVSSLYQGETFSLGSLLTNNLALANHPVWAVVAAANNNIYTSYADPSSAPPSLAPHTFNGLTSSVNQIGYNITSGSGAGDYAYTNASAQYSFYYDNNPTEPDGTTLANNYGVVGAAFSGTSQVQDFWSADKAGDPATESGLYTWTLATNGILTYGSVVVANPQLKIALSGSNYILTGTNAASATLQSTTNLASSWSAVSPQPTIVNGQFTVTNAITVPYIFYRLQQ
jgi:hypothetical protein